MSAHTTIQVGLDRFRVGAWHADARLAYIAPAITGAGPSPAGVRACVERLAAEGYRGAVTSALRDDEARSFTDAGFRHHESLHVLHRRVDRPELPPAPRLRSRRARRADRPAVLEVDHAAFGTFWQLDDAGLREAIDATPAARFRVTGRPIVGYAVCGRAQRVGYLQRLAVRPDRARDGIGSALVLDAIHWLRRHGATDVLVNTQEANHGAVALYRKLGFELLDDRLHVLRSTW